MTFRFMISRWWCILSGQAVVLSYMPFMRLYGRKNTDCITMPRIALYGFTELLCGCDHSDQHDNRTQFRITQVGATALMLSVCCWLRLCVAFVTNKNKICLLSPEEWWLFPTDNCDSCTEMTTRIAALISGCWMKCGDWRPVCVGVGGSDRLAI